MAFVARQYPELRLITMSPENFSGTQVALDLALPVRLPIKVVLVPLVMPLFGIAQGVDKGAKRLLAAG